MAQPTAFVPQHEYWNDEGINPNFPGSELDIDFGNIRGTLDQVLVNLALIQRDDGALKNQSVGLEQLTTAVRAMLGDIEALEAIEDDIDAIDNSVAAAAASALAAAGAAEAAIAASAVRYDEAQPLTDGEKEQARTNIDAGYKAFDTIADLASADVPSVVMALWTRGYHTAGTGGCLRIRQASSGPGRVQSADGAYWEVAEPVVSVTMCGAYGDGVEDDTDAILDAVDLCIAREMRSLHFPATGVGASPGLGGTVGYLVTAPIPLPGSRWEVFGDGKDATSIIAGYDGDIFQLDVTSETSYLGTIRDLGFVRDSATYSNTKAIHVIHDGVLTTGLQHWTFSHLRFEGVYHGVYYDQTGLLLWSGVNSIGAHAFNVHNEFHVPLSASGRYPLEVVRFAGSIGPHQTFTGGRYRAENVGIKAGDGAASSVGDLIVLGVHFVLGDAAMHLIGPTTANAYNLNIVISGCQFDGLDTYLLKLSNVGLVKAFNNNFTGGAVDHLLTSVSNSIIDGPAGRLDSYSTLPWTIDRPVVFGNKNLTFGTQTISQTGGRFTQNGWMSIGAGAAATIASGVAAVTRTCMILDTEGGAATDDLDSVTGGTAGDILVIRTASSNRDITVKHSAGAGGAGTFRLNSATDKVLSSAFDVIWFENRGGLWCQVAFGDNA